MLVLFSGIVLLMDLCARLPLVQVLADYNKSLVCFENVLKLSASFNEARLRYHAVLCHQKVERALRQQHDTLQKTLEDLQGYQKQQELWLQYQHKLMSEQALPSQLLEQRLLYREHKIREIIDESINSGSTGTGGGNGSGPNSGPSDSKQAAPQQPSSIGASSGAAGAAGHVPVVHHRHVPSDACATGKEQQQDVDGGGGDSAGDGRGCNTMPVLIPITFT